MNYSVKVENVRERLDWCQTFYEVTIEDEEFVYLYTFMHNYSDDTIKELDTSDKNETVHDAIQCAKYLVVALQAVDAYLEDV